VYKTAQCACGAASITVSGEPEMHGLCHCTNCKRRTVSAFGISSYFPRKNVVAQTGEMQIYAFHFAAQSHDQERYFCKVCGTTLYLTVSTLLELIGTAGGCFADAHLSEPTYSVTYAKKLPWVRLPEGWKTWD
jgi:hypothetical protein